MRRKKKVTAAARALQQKNARRRWLTFLRMIRYGANNITRNAWLTVAATAVMTITLLVIFTMVTARTVLVDTTNQIRDQVNMSIYLKTDTTNDQAAEVRRDLERLDSVTSVTYISPSEARTKFADEHRDDPEMLSALNEASNQFPGTLSIKVVDINDSSELKEFVGTNEAVGEYIDPNLPPSFESQRSEAISEIGRWVVYAERFGIGAAVLFISISSLIIFNTIRMAIFSRKDEIEMMKLIGADRGFIRGPFIVEAIFYGFIAAIMATGLGVLILYSLRESLLAAGVQVETVLQFVTDYALLTLLGMIVIGAVIGVCSSLLATRRYLKI